MQFPLTFYFIHAHKRQTQKKTLKKLFYSKDREATHIKKWNCSIKWERYLMWNIRHNYLGFGKLSTIRHKALKDTTAQTKKKWSLSYNLSWYFSSFERRKAPRLLFSHSNTQKCCKACMLLHIHSCYIIWMTEQRNIENSHHRIFKLPFSYAFLYDTITYVALFSVFLFFFYTFVCWCFEYFFVVCEKKMLLCFFFFSESPGYK